MMTTATSATTTSSATATATAAAAAAAETSVSSSSLLEPRTHHPTNRFAVAHENSPSQERPSQEDESPSNHATSPPPPPPRPPPVEDHQHHDEDDEIMSAAVIRVENNNDQQQQQQQPPSRSSATTSGGAAHRHHHHHHHYGNGYNTITRNMNEVDDLTVSTPAAYPVNPDDYDDDEEESQGRASFPPSLLFPTASTAIISTPVLMVQLDEEQPTTTTTNNNTLAADGGNTTYLNSDRLSSSRRQRRRKRIPKRHWIYFTILVVTFLAVLTAIATGLLLWIQRRSASLSSSNNGNNNYIPPTASPPPPPTTTKCDVLDNNNNNNITYQEFRISYSISWTTLLASSPHLDTDTATAISSENLGWELTHWAFQDPTFLLLANPSSVEGYGLQYQLWNWDDDHHHLEEYNDDAEITTPEWYKDDLCHTRGSDGETGSNGIVQDYYAQLCLGGADADGADDVASLEDYATLEFVAFAVTPTTQVSVDLFYHLEAQVTIISMRYHDDAHHHETYLVAQRTVYGMAFQPVLSQDGSTLAVLWAKDYSYDEFDELEEKDGRVLNLKLLVFQLQEVIPSAEDEQQQQQQDLSTFHDRYLRLLIDLSADDDFPLRTDSTIFLSLQYNALVVSTLDGSALEFRLRDETELPPIIPPLPTFHNATVEAPAFTEDAFIRRIYGSHGGGGKGSSSDNTNDNSNIIPDRPVLLAYAAGAGVVAVHFPIIALYDVHTEVVVVDNNNNDNSANDDDVVQFLNVRRDGFVPESEVIWEGDSHAAFAYNGERLAVLVTYDKLNEDDGGVAVVDLVRAIIYRWDGAMEQYKFDDSFEVLPMTVVDDDDDDDGAEDDDDDDDDDDDVWIEGLFWDTDGERLTIVTNQKVLIYEHYEVTEDACGRTWLLQKVHLPSAD